MGTLGVEVIGEAVAARFARRHAAAKKPLQRFLRLAREAEWKHLPDVKQTFRDADYTASGRIVFDIGGNKYRLIAKIDFEEQMLLIEEILTHEEYDRKEL